MWVRMEKIVEIFSDNKNYKKLNTYYYGRIAVASVFPISTPKSLSAAKYFFKCKAQMKKRLVALNLADTRRESRPEGI